MEDASHAQGLARIERLKRVAKGASETAEDELPRSLEDHVAAECDLDEIVHHLERHDGFVAHLGEDRLSGLPRGLLGTIPAPRHPRKGPNEDKVRARHKKGRLETGKGPARGQALLRIGKLAAASPVDEVVVELRDLGAESLHLGWEKDLKKAFARGSSREEDALGK